MSPYRRQDPVLLKLNTSTVTALNNAGLTCLEDLFSVAEDEIYSISGIGKKRGREILNLLHSLPFDYMDDTLPGNPEKNPYAGIDSTLAEALSNSFYHNDKYVSRGLRYYQNGRVGQIKLADESTQEYILPSTDPGNIRLNCCLQPGTSCKYIAAVRPLHNGTGPIVNMSTPPLWHWPNSSG